MGAAAALTLAFLVAQPATSARAAEYPSWSDVQHAKANQKAAAAKVKQVDHLITTLTTDAEKAQAEAESLGKKAAAAQDAFDAANRRTKALESEAATSKRQARTATQQAGLLAAQLYRTGGPSLSVDLFLSAGDQAGSTEPDQLLADLGSMSRLVERSRGIYVHAAAATNQATALAGQATAAAQERARLKKDADDALQVAAAAAKRAQAALSSQKDHIVVLRAQLAALKDTTSKTVAGYENGVEVRRKAAEEAQRRAAAAAARAAASAGGGFSSGAGSVTSSGWTAPVNGVITAGFGPRVAPCAGCTSWHEGVDIATAGGSPIHAAASGTVEYAGPMGDYGNFVLLDHGGGVQTAYGHIMPGGILVSIGEHVGAGQQIARVGSTGHSTGFHLHFEVRINGARVDPVAYLRQRGVSLG
jgi:murein DD-endopeptidase MepM/ murein hydrolase activator NlpD